MPSRRLEELTGDLLGKALIAVLDGATANACDRGDERQGHQHEADQPDGDADPRPVASPELGPGARRPRTSPVTSPRRAVEQPPPARVGAIEGSAGKQRRERQPDEL